MASTPSRNITVQLLRLIRNASRNEGMTVAELIYALWESEDLRFRGLSWYYIDGEFGSPRSHERISDLLRELQDLGLIQATSVDDSTGNEKWKTSSSWQLPDDGESGNDGGENGPPNAPGDVDGPGDGGRGIAEVLSHPLLFSLDQGEFDSLVDNLFVNESA